MLISLKITRFSFQTSVFPSNLHFDFLKRWISLIILSGDFLVFSRHTSKSGVVLLKTRLWFSEWVYLLLHRKYIMNIFGDKFANLIERIYGVVSVWIYVYSSARSLFQFKFRFENKIKTRGRDFVAISRNKFPVERHELWRGFVGHDRK